MYGDSECALTPPNKHGGPRLRPPAPAQFMSLHTVPEITGRAADPVRAPRPWLRRGGGVFAVSFFTQRGRGAKL